MAGKGKILLSITGFSPQRWYEMLSEEREVVLEPNSEVDPTIEYAVVWKQKLGLLAQLPNLKVIFSIGAGVDNILADATLPNVQIVRVVSDHLTKQMVEYVLWRVLDHHRNGQLYHAQQIKKTWHELPQQLAEEIAIGIMGLGNLGRAAANALAAIGFLVNGWSRRPQDVAGINTFVGDAGLVPFLNTTDILVVLLPLTDATMGIINYSLLKALRRCNRLGGAVIINAGRGKLQRDSDILRALDDGTLKEASLDVFEIEPLPRTSKLWSHPKVYVTPHVAAISNPAHIVGPMLKQMDAFERGKPLENIVDRSAGY